MRKIIFCILLFVYNAGISGFAQQLELTDVIKKARDLEIQKQLAVKNTVKEVKDDIANKEQSASEIIKPKEIVQEK